jgi:hypothetical protein
VTDQQENHRQDLTEDRQESEGTTTNTAIILGRMVTSLPEDHAITIDRAPEVLMEVEVGRSHLDDPLDAIRIVQRPLDVPTLWSTRATPSLAHPLR